jgi:hypothetical protein
MINIIFLVHLTTKYFLLIWRRNILIKRYDFSESQDGKIYCDANIAYSRSKTRQHVTADVQTANETRKAIDLMGGVTGCQAAHVEINQTLAEESNKRKNTCNNKDLKHRVEVNIC